MKLVISDHALLRFIERQYGVDIEDMRQKIEAVAYPAAVAGASGLKIGTLNFIMRRDPVRENLVTISTVKERGMDRFNRNQHNAKKNRQKEKAR